MAMVQMESQQALHGAGENPLKILNRGPHYFRERVLKHNSVLIKHHRKSAVELLEETKPLYVKSEHALGSTQEEQTGNEVNSTPVVRGKTSDPTLLDWPVLDPSDSGYLRLNDSTGKNPPARVVTGSILVREPWKGSRGPVVPQHSGKAPDPPPKPVTYVGACSVKNTNKASGASKQPHSQDLVSCSSGSKQCLRSQPCSGNGDSNKHMMAGKALGKSMADLKKETTASTTSLPVDPSAYLSPEDWRETRTDTSSEMDKHSTNSLKVPIKLDDHNIVMVHRRPKKAIHRSRSDLTKRFSNSSDLSELSARFSRNSADLEKFFNEMGLDRTVLEPMMTSQWNHSSSDLHLFESCSSLDSPDGRSWCSGESNKKDPDHARLKPESSKDRTAPPSSVNVVERNARIIKWLCSVKKATSQEED